MTQEDPPQYKMDPPEENTFPDADEAFDFIRAHALHAGYGIRKSGRKWGKDRMLERMFVVCDRSAPDTSQAVIRPRKSRGCGCPFSMLLRRTDDGKIALTHHVSQHNHEPFKNPRDHPCFRKLTSRQEKKVLELGLDTPIGVMHNQLLAEDPTTLVLRQDIMNYCAQRKREMKAGKQSKKVSKKESPVPVKSADDYAVTKRAKHGRNKLTPREVMALLHRIPSESSDAEVRSTLSTCQFHGLRGACTLCGLTIGSYATSFKKNGCIQLLTDYWRRKIALSGGSLEEDGYGRRESGDTESLPSPDTSYTARGSYGRSLFDPPPRPNVSTRSQTSFLTREDNVEGRSALGRAMIDASRSSISEHDESHQPEGIPGTTVNPFQSHGLQPISHTTSNQSMGILKHDVKAKLAHDKEMGGALRLLNVLFSDQVMPPPEKSSDEAWMYFWNEAVRVYRSSDERLSTLLSSLEALFDLSIEVSVDIVSAWQALDMWGHLVKRYERMLHINMIRHSTSNETLAVLCNDRIDLLYLHEWQQTKSDRYEALRALLRKRPRINFEDSNMDDRQAHSSDTESEDTNKRLLDDDVHSNASKKQKTGDSELLTARLEDAARYAEVVERVFRAVKVAQDGGCDKRALERLESAATQCVDRLSASLEGAWEKPELPGESSRGDDE